MAETISRGIQATLFDYFQDTEYFDLQEANELLLEHQNRGVNRESIRARIYEGIDKGLFERVGKGLYTVTRKDEQGRENTCLLINGDGRDLSMLQDNSVDAIITDHPYSLKISLKGGNRNFADYELFQYNEQDMLEKFRVLRPGHFLVEFLPEENGDNYQYLFQVKELARKAGFEYYAKVPWKKSGFVANTGRKSKDTEDICFFSKGRARDLRPDAKKDKQYAATHETVEFKEHLPGCSVVRYSDMGGIPSSSQTDQEPINVDIRISVLKEDAARAREMLEDAWYNALQDSYEKSPLDTDNGGEYSITELFDMPIQDYILKYAAKQGLIFDDLSNGPVEHFMSGAAGMLPTIFDVAPPSRGEKVHQAEKPLVLIEQIIRFITREDEWVLDQFGGSGVTGKAALSTHRNSIVIEKDLETFNKMRAYVEALGNVAVKTPEQREAVNVAIDALEAVYDGPEHMKAFADRQNRFGMFLVDAFHTLPDILNEEDNIAFKDAIDAAGKAIEAADLQEEMEKSQSAPEKKVLECSSRGDRRFSALFATVTIKGKEKSIEEWYQDAKRTEDGKRAGKGKPFDHIICPFTGDKLPSKDAADLYRGLWITYLNNHPDLVGYASQFDDFTDVFRAQRQELSFEELEAGLQPDTTISPADIIGAYAKGDKERYVAAVKSGHWYQNMASKKKQPLDQQIKKAAEKQEAQKEEKAEQISLFPRSTFRR